MAEKLTPEQQALLEAKEMTQIDELVRNLKRYEPQSDADRNPAVDKGITLVRDVVSQHPEGAIPGALVLLSGSMQYHDPVHMDIDLIWFVKEFSYEESDHKNRIARSLDRMSTWPDPYTGDENTLLVGMDRLRKEASEFSFSREILENDTSAQYSGMILSASPLFPQDPVQRELHAYFQSEVRELLHEFPLLRKGVLRELRSVERVRKERRKQRGIKFSSRRG